MSNHNSHVEVQFAAGGFIVRTCDGSTNTTEVVVSQAKLMKLLRAKVEQLSLVAKKTDDAEE